MPYVLVLDDDIHIAELVRVVLADAGYDVRVSTERDIPGGAFDCVVTDLMSVTAYTRDDARDWILRVRDRLPNVPVIVVTAHPEAARDAPSLGARAVIMKPFDVEQLLKTVREVIAP